MQSALFELPPIHVVGGRTCNDCGFTKPLSQYQIEGPRRQGEGQQGEGEFFYKRRCKECCSRLGRMQRMLSKEHRLRLYQEQQGCCALCGRPEDSTTRPLGLDHCHYTNRVRGLLCMRCNTGLGMLGLDCPPDELLDRIQRVLQYLQ